MKKSELIQVIKEEHKYIKNLLEEKGRIESLLSEKAEIEKKLDEINAAENSIVESDEVDETTGLGQGVNRRASHKGEAGSKLKKEEELEEMSGLSKTTSNVAGADTTNPVYKNRKKRGYVNEEKVLRTIIKNQLLETYGLKKNP